MHSINFICSLIVVTLISDSIAAIGRKDDEWCLTRTGFCPPHMLCCDGTFCCPKISRCCKESFNRCCPYWTENSDYKIIGIRAIRISDGAKSSD
uniref:Cysteine rich secreted protein n=1 Tax=Riptortus pedestris TaxID=329032 RepID=R4WRV9_RIPPE|nr:cysteine rich secreted protein [Riptortus pedestris]